MISFKEMGGDVICAEQVADSLQNMEFTPDIDPPLHASAQWAFDERSCWLPYRETSDTVHGSVLSVSDHVRGCMIKLQAL